MSTSCVACYLIVQVKTDIWNNYYKIHVLILPVSKYLLKVSTHTCILPGKKWYQCIATSFRFLQPKTDLFCSSDLRTPTTPWLYHIKMMQLEAKQCQRCGH